MKIRRVVFFSGVAVIAVAAIPFCLALGRNPFPTLYSFVAEDRHGVLLGARVSADGQWRFPPSDSVPARMAMCLLISEDKRFFRHPGIDPIALARALVHDLRAGKVVEGGSTLTQQLARLSRRARHGPRPRTVMEKIPEALEAMAFEVRWSKRDILARYAAHAPFGANVVGLEAAAWRWFGKTSVRLSWAEAALLACLPNRPARLHPSGDRKALQVRRDRLLRRLRSENHFSGEDLSLALREPLPISPRPLPDWAPHLVSGLAVLHPSGGRFRLTLDAGLQRDALAAALNHRRDLLGLDVKGLAVIGTELGSDGRPEVRVYIGHPQPGDPDAGRVDGAQAPRSPGSALKPFLYGLALDQGALLPRQWILDIPTRFGDFTPENALRNYRGAVAADLALCLSLNVPFVRLLRDVGTESFLGQLRRLGFGHLNQTASHYGLSLVLGGGEVTLAELNAAYAALLPDSRAGALRVGHGPLSVDGKGHELVLPGGLPPDAISESARQGILNALTKPGRVEEEAWRTQLGPARPLAWKTGTSFGQRDAWALGLTPRHCVGIWAGNPSGEGRAGLWGARSAAPLLFRILDRLETQNGNFPSREFDGLPQGMPVASCALTGFRAGSDCPHRDTVWVPEAGRMATTCPWHRRIQITTSDHRMARPDCARGAALRDSLVFDPPGAVAAYLRSGGGDFRPLPPVAPGCDTRRQDEALEILQPEQDARLTPGMGFGGVRQRLVFEAGHRDPKAVLHWFLDGEYLGETARFHQLGANPKKGRHTLVVSDEEGRSAGVGFQVLR